MRFSEQSVVGNSGALKGCCNYAQSRRTHSGHFPRRRPVSKSFAEDGEGSNLIYELLVHPAIPHS